MLSENSTNIAIRGGVKQEENASDMCWAIFHRFLARSSRQECLVRHGRMEFDTLIKLEPGRNHDNLRMDVFTGGLGALFWERPEFRRLVFR